MVLLASSRTLTNRPPTLSLSTSRSLRQRSMRARVHRTSRHDPAHHRIITVSLCRRFTARRSLMAVRLPRSRIWPGSVGSGARSSPTLGSHQACLLFCIITCIYEGVNGKTTDVHLNLCLEKSKYLGEKEFPKLQ